jgi:hypothetical protein
MSADAGPRSLVVAWDTTSGQPLWTLRAPHAGGVAAMALSGDGRLLATLSAPPVAGAGGAGGTAVGSEGTREASTAPHVQEVMVGGDD